MATESKPFSVETRNTATQERMGFSAREEIARKSMLASRPDIVGFQECGDEGRKAILPQNPWYAVHPGYLAGDIRLNTIVWRGGFEKVESGDFALSPNGLYEPAWDGETRGASWVHLVEKETGFPLLVINYHPDNKGVTARAEAAKLVVEFANSFPASQRLPTIILCDSNCSVDSPNPRWREPEYRKPYDLLLQAGFRDTWVETHRLNPTRPPTYHMFQGQDYGGDEFGTWDTEWILVRNGNGLGIKILNCVIVRDSEGGTHPSDHYSMKSTMQLQLL